MSFGELPSLWDRFINSLQFKYWEYGHKYVWESWHVEWKESTCEPGVRFDEHESDHVTREKLVNYPGFYQGATWKDVGGPKIGIGGGKVTEEGWEVTAGGIPIAGGGQRPSAPTEVGSLKVHTGDVMSKEEFDATSKLIDNLMNHYEQKQYDDFGEMVLEGYVTESTEDADAVRTGPWMVDSKTGMGEGMSLLGKEFTGKELKSLGLKLPYSNEGRGIGDITFSELRDDDVYLFAAVLSERTYDSYNIQGYYHDVLVHTDNTNSVTLRMQYGYIRYKLMKLKQGRIPQD